MNISDPQKTHPTLAAFAEQVVGPIRTIEDRSREFGRRSTTWRIIGVDGAVCYLKQNEHRTHYLAEEIAYRTWVPRIPRENFWHAPELLGSSSELSTIVITEASGSTLLESNVGDEDERRMFWIAGWLAAQIHQIKVDPTLAGAPRTYDRVLWNNLLEKGEPHLDGLTLAAIDRRITEELQLSGLDIVPTHSDSSPRNWLFSSTDGQVSIGLIDWERARPSYWLEDAQRLAYDYWLRKPHLRAQFFNGYGRFPSEEEERQMKVICLANALGTVSWANDHDDHGFEAFGRRTIATILKELG